MVLLYVSNISNGAASRPLVLFWLVAWETSQMWSNQGFRFSSEIRSYKYMYCLHIIHVRNWRTERVGSWANLVKVYVFIAKITSSCKVPNTQFEWNRRRKLCFLYQTWWIVSFLFSFKNQTTLDRLKIKHDEMPISTVGICMSENSIKNSESWYSKEFELWYLWFHIMPLVSYILR